MTSQRSTDAPQNLREFERWRTEHGAYTCDDYYLRQVNRKWTILGKWARQPAAAALRRGRPIG